MNPVRVGIAAPGVALIAYGAYRLLSEIPAEDLVSIGVWLAAALVLHDAVVAPVTVGLGVVLARWVPPRARRYVQGTAVAAALVTVIALPLIHRQGTQPSVKALLAQSYGTNLAVLVAGICAVGMLLYGVRVVRDRAASTALDKTANERPPEHHHSETE